MSIDELVNYFHPLYLNGEIKTHNDLKKHLIELNSSNQDQLSEVELVLTNAFKKIDLLKEENKSLIDRVNHANDQDYFEGGGREIEEFHNTLTETMKEVVSAIRSINPDAAFTIPSPKILFESFYESERNKKVVAILHPYDFCEGYWESILPLIKWKDSTANNPTNKEIMAEIDKVQESNKIDINLFRILEGCVFKESLNSGLNLSLSFLNIVLGYLPCVASVILKYF